ncbi:MAG: carbohydrate-binding domain-containing protein, partial [Synergistaceae bacterium]|nr:carbohydrate-binding domain-containing protein [Synergistaceae bacterium]
APALVFYSAIECGPTENVVSFDVSRNMLGDDELSHAGAFIVIADGSTNNVKGANVYRILKADKKDSASKIDGTDISDQKKMYKMDGALYSFVSLVIGAESNNGGGRLNITSTTYEGLGSELHLLIDSGTINITAEDDGINVNKDNVSVFTMNGGSLKITAKNGDGIDSNGYVVINNGTLDITAVKDSNQLNAETDGPIDALLDVYMSDTVTYTHQAYDPKTDTGNEDSSEGNNNNNTSSRKPVVIYGEDNAVLMRINFATPVKDDNTSSRTIKNSDEVFTLQHRINNFSGIRLKESN